MLQHKEAKVSATLTCDDANATAAQGDQEGDESNLQTSCQEFLEGKGKHVCPYVLKIQERVSWEQVDNLNRFEQNSAP